MQTNTVHDIRHEKLEPNEKIFINPITAKLKHKSTEPFSMYMFENFFSEEIYSLLCEELNKKLQLGLADKMAHDRFGRSEATIKTDGVPNRYGAYIHRFSPDQIGPFSIFYSKIFFDFFQNILSFPLSPHIIGSVHHHKINSPSGWVHNDYHFCNFPWRPNAEGMNPFADGCQYQYGYDTRPEIMKCFRSLAILYYFGNKEWKSGEGGETAFFKSVNPDSVFLKSPPINNNLVAFECSPASWHAYSTNLVSERNAAVFWFHSEPYVALQRFKVLPNVAFNN